MTWNRIDDPENPPPAGLHVRGLWARIVWEKRFKYWQAEVGLINDSGDFVSSTGDLTAFPTECYEYWAPLPAPPEDEG